MNNNVTKRKNIVDVDRKERKREDGRKEREERREKNVNDLY